jgi:hypothetical protein
MAPGNDPYLRDRNIRSAAGINLIGAIFIGALLGWAVVGWFDMKVVSEGAGAAIGAVGGAILASVLLSAFGGRATR